ncbi:TlpA family protein disulfide reductase [Avrilella dinanensis]|uniref:Thioredoxin domain-containing protein n=1 Tax=Avrilella dinanensis TaxID=2008672 RepID=A0A2M9R7B4_9FLAO|nr:TlpA disulfide reductase family protein [Avrilella dinanensis]PJR04749.1 hypothetical protein CDL10_09495 [Avrilella dinanensis]
MKKLSKFQFVLLNIILLIILIGSGGFLPVIYKLLITCVLFFFAAWYLLSRSPFSKKMSFIIIFLPILLIYGSGYIYALVYDEAYLGKPFFWTYLVLAIILYIKDSYQFSKLKLVTFYIIFCLISAGVAHYTTVENRAKKIEHSAFNQAGFRDKEGNQFGFESFKGKLTVLEFWSVVCANCPESMTKVQNFAEQYKNDERIDFYLVNVELKENDRRLKKIEDQYHLKKLYIEKDKFEELNIQVTPGMIVLNPEGKIVFAGYPTFYKSKYNYIVDILENEISKL